MRVRVHGDLDRIETLPESIQMLAHPGIIQALTKRFKELGFRSYSPRAQGI